MGSMDKTFQIQDVQIGEYLYTLIGHSAKIISLKFDIYGKYTIMDSFDKTIRMWDIRNGKVVHTFKDYKYKVSATQFNYSVSFTLMYEL